MGGSHVGHRWVSTGIYSRFTFNTMIQKKAEGEVAVRFSIDFEMVYCRRDCPQNLPPAGLLFSVYEVGPRKGVHF